MKKMILLFAILSLVLTSCLYAKDFDFSTLNNVKIGMSKNQLISFLKKNQIEYKENDKFIHFQPNFKLFGCKIKMIYCKFENHKLFSFRIDIEKNDYSFFEYNFTKNSNCKEILDNSNSYKYHFDNCMVVGFNDPDDVCFMFLYCTPFPCK